LSFDRAIIVTTSSRTDRLTRYLAVGDVHLTDEDISAIDKAGKKGESKMKMWNGCKMGAKVVLLGGMGVWALSKYVL
jgi:diketogulonate reductase-like aldo/keto reductase